MLNLILADTFLKQKSWSQLNAEILRLVIDVDNLPPPICCSILHSSEQRGHKNRSLQERSVRKLKSSWNVCSKYFQCLNHLWAERLTLSLVLLSLIPVTKSVLDQGDQVDPNNDPKLKTHQKQVWCWNEMNNKMRDQPLGQKSDSLEVIVEQKCLLFNGVLCI